MRALLAALALLASATALAAPASADHCWADVPPCEAGRVDCTDPATPPALCSPTTVDAGRAWASVDAAYCLRQQYWNVCAEEQATGASCTLDLPPGRCGNAMAAAGLRP